MQMGSRASCCVVLQFPVDEPLMTTTGVPSVAVANGIRTLHVDHFRHSEASVLLKSFSWCGAAGVGREGGPCLLDRVTPSALHYHT